MYCMDFAEITGPQPDLAHVSFWSKRVREGPVTHDAKVLISIDNDAFRLAPGHARTIKRQ